jgi:penicillin G amidase
MFSSRAKLIIGALSVLLLLALAGALFIRYQIRKSFPSTEGSAAVAGLAAPVEIQRDEYGVATVVARSENDMAFGQGYLHAQDRLWQMDMQRRAASGRLSELFGKETVPFDRMFRVVGIRRAGERIVEGLPPETREYAESYVRGVNAFIETHHGKYPAEFDLLRYDPEPWTVLDCVLVARLLAWELNLAWWTDLTMGAIQERVGEEKVKDILPSYPSSVPPTVPPVKRWHFAELGEGMRNVQRAYLDFRGSGGFTTGSNAWVVAPWKSTTGSVLLANDTHLQLTLPSQWYEVQLKCPAYHVGGMSVPGVPGVAVGRNDSIAWGVTNLMADDADFYIERLDSVSGTNYWYDGSWHPLSVRTEEITVRGDSAVAVVIRETRNGPIVTDIQTPLQKARLTFGASMRWTGAETDDQIGAFRQIDRATDWRSFSAGVKLFAIPGQNFVYGDARGNIGYRCGVRLPVRPKRSAILPLPGWEKSSAWKGFVPFEQLPSLYNPAEGFIASANNKIVDDSYPYHISDLWEPPARFQRLRDVLGRKGEIFSVEDFERLQNDTYSLNAFEIVPYIFAAFSDTPQVGADERRLLEYLRNWHYYFARDDIAAAIYHTFLVRLMENTYRDELGDELYHDWVILANVPLRVTTRLLKEGTSPWFDDVRTTGIVETRDDIVRKSLREAAQQLKQRFGDDSKLWRWGDLHTVTLRHPFGTVKPLDRIFNIGPFPMAGGSTALISGEYSFNDPFAAMIGPAFRQVFDMGNQHDVRAVLPSGQSGQIFHPHYGDQTRLWLMGGYRIESWNGDTKPRATLLLEPKQ